MDRTWIKHSAKFSARYHCGVVEFMEFVKARFGDEDVLCPCSMCVNSTGTKTPEEVHDHLHLHGMPVSYTNWIYHGELDGAPGII